MAVALIVLMGLVFVANAVLESKRLVYGIAGAAVVAVVVAGIVTDTDVEPWHYSAYVVVLLVGAFGSAAVRRRRGLAA